MTGPGGTPVHPDRDRQENPMPRLTIPDFDGRPVDAAHNAYSGSDETPPAILDPGEEVFLIVRATVSGVALKEDRFGRLVRVQSLRVTHSLPADSEAVEQVRDEIKRQEDDAAGQTSLDDDLDAVVDLDG
jgi:hypothetical protein